MTTTFQILTVVPGLLLAVILHEIAHGYVAEKMGDPTARQAGRITLNPIPHIDLYMTILLPALLIAAGSPIVFGGAKPVPINPYYFKNPRKSMIWVALAGPTTNIILAVFSYLLFVAIRGISINQIVPFLVQITLVQILAYSVIINLVLAIFNLLPIPPLDGGRIAVGLLPTSLAQQLAKLERFGLIIVIVLLISGVLGRLLTPLLDFVLRLLN